MTTDSAQQGFIRRFADAGIVQFGLFADGAPVSFNLALLPAYPAILRHIGELGAQRIGTQKVDRLITSRDSLPSGVSISLSSDIPLAYREVNSEGARIVGAYDTGHATALIINCWLGVREEQDPIIDIISHCSRVGLDVVHILSVLGTAPAPRGFSGTCECLIRLDEMIAALELSGDLPKGQAAAVTNWLSSHSP